MHTQLCSRLDLRCYQKWLLTQNMDKASRATEKAAEELGQASREIERAALKFQTDMDKTLPEMAAASREFQELVRQDPLRASITVRVAAGVGKVQHQALELQMMQNQPLYPVALRCIRHR